jgi:cobalt-zinc-cadmium efflux system membrane fusion protein
MKASKRMNIWGQLQAGALAALSLVACDPGPTIGPGPAGEEADTIVLTAEETAQAGIRTHPAIVGTFKGYRDFPAIVQPNANRLADITTLVRGRVTDIYVDLGADVKTGQLLARLQSPDLAVAQSVFLKGQAREHEAQLVFERARDLYASKAVSLAEFQRRDAEFATARAESRETRHRLQLLGMRPQEIDQLARDERIRSDVEIRAPFDGRILARTIARGEIVETTDKLFTPPTCRTSGSWPTCRKRTSAASTGIIRSRRAWPPIPARSSRGGSPTWETSSTPPPAR